MSCVVVDQVQRSLLQPLYVVLAFTTAGSEHERWYRRKMEITFQFLFTIDEASYHLDFYGDSPAFSLPIAHACIVQAVHFAVARHPSTRSIIKTFILWISITSLLQHQLQLHCKCAHTWQRVHYENWNKLLCIRWHSARFSFHISKSWQNRRNCYFFQRFRCALYRDKFKLRERLWHLLLLCLYLHPLR